MLVSPAAPGRRGLVSRATSLQGNCASWAPLACWVCSGASPHGGLEFLPPRGQDTASRDEWSLGVQSTDSPDAGARDGQHQTSVAVTSRCRLHIQIGRAVKSCAASPERALLE